jgi:hypothetical protein
MSSVNFCHKSLFVPLGLSKFLSRFMDALTMQAFMAFPPLSSRQWMGTILNLHSGSEFGVTSDEVSLYSTVL